MNSPTRLLNSSMSISSMCAVSAVAGGEASSSSFCLPSTSFSPVHCHQYSALGELSLSSSSLDAAIPFVASSQLTSFAQPSSGISSQNHRVATPQYSSANNSLLASPVISRSPRPIESPNISLLAHDLVLSPTFRQVCTNYQSDGHQTLLLQTPCQSLSEAPLILSHNKSFNQQRTSPQNNSSIGLLSLSNNASTSNSNANRHSPIVINQSSTKGKDNTQATALHFRPVSSPVAQRVSMSSMSSSTVQSTPSAAIKRPVRPVIAIKPRQSATPSNLSSRKITKTAKGSVSTGPGQAEQLIVSTPFIGGQPSILNMDNQQGLASVVISAQQPATAVQGLLIEVPGQSQPLLAIPPVVQPAVQQPLLITAPATQISHAFNFETVNSIDNHFHSTQLTIPTTNSQSRARNYPATQQTIRKLSNNAPSEHQALKRKITDSSAVKLNPTVTASRNLNDEEIPTKPINLENLNCARSLVSFPPTLPAFSKSAKQNFDNFMSMSRLSLLASPTGGTPTPSIIGGSRPTSPNSNLLSLSPTLTTGGSDLPGSLPGFTPAQLAQGLRLADASHLAPDTTISGIVVGKLLDDVRRCRERRTRFGIAQQEVANHLVPVHGEIFRQASICKLENLSLKLELANRMVTVLEKFYDEKEEEFKRISAIRGANTDFSLPKRTRTRFNNNHSQRHCFSDEARDYLRGVFSVNPYPGRQLISEIAEKINVPRENVRVWFSNRRIEKKKKTGMNSLKSPTSAAPSLDMAATGSVILSKAPSQRSRSNTITSSSSASLLNTDEEIAMHVDSHTELTSNRIITSSEMVDKSNGNVFYLSETSATDPLNFFHA